MPRYRDPIRTASFAYDLRRWRARYRLTQLQAAGLAGCQKAQWARWERGEVFPDASWELRLYRLLDTDPEGQDVPASYREPRVS
ncbi:MAG TPA: helix-turn-helix domain-containing protein [Propionibacteriaceae bacterium]|nr:helix-turn-helix domain-containing protein [Propionibacteriaceae bacterium]